jgi:hypothetical protein
MSVKRPTLSSGDTVGLLRGSCSCRHGAPHSAIRLERHLDGSATALRSLSAAVCMAVVDCPVLVPFSVLSATGEILYCSLWRLSSRDFRFPPRCRSYLRSSELLHSICWQLVTNVSGQHIGPMLKCQAVQGHWLKPVLRDVPQRRPRCCQLPRLSRGWCLNECIWSTGGMTLTGYKYLPRYSFQCQVVHHKPHTYRPGTSWSVRALTPAMICPTRQLVEDVHDASRVISHKTKTVTVRHLPQSEKFPSSLLKICNPKCCKLFRSYLHFLLPCDTSSLLRTEERPSFLFVAYRSSSQPDIPEDCYLGDIGRWGWRGS